MSLVLSSRTCELKSRVPLSGLVRLADGAEPRQWASTPHRNTVSEVRLSFYYATLRIFTIKSPGISESLNAEIAPLGLRSVIIEPGYFRTSFLTADNRGAHIPRIDDYNEISKAANDRLLGEFVVELSIIAMIYFSNRVQRQTTWRPKEGG